MQNCQPSINEGKQGGDFVLPLHRSRLDMLAYTLFLKEILAPVSVWRFVFSHKISTSSFSTGLLNFSNAIFLSSVLLLCCVLFMFC